MYATILYVGDWDMQGGRRFRAVKRRRRNLKNPPLRRISQKKLTCNVSLTAAVTCWQNDVNNSPHTHTHTRALPHKHTKTSFHQSTKCLLRHRGKHNLSDLLCCHPPPTHTLSQQNGPRTLGPLWWITKQRHSRNTVFFLQHNQANIKTLHSIYSNVPNQTAVAWNIQLTQCFVNCFYCISGSD